MGDDRLRQRIERLLAPSTVYDTVSGETRTLGPPVHVKARDLRRILDVDIAPERVGATSEGAGDE